jgi:hypothetical protein
MSILPQRQYGLYITLGLAVVGAIVAGVILITSGQASETDLSSARYVPDGKPDASSSAPPTCTASKPSTR